MKKPVLLTVFGLCSLIAACGASLDSGSEPKIIIGENLLQYYLEDDNISNSIGRIARGCTATHIGDRYVLTAGHCVPDAECNSRAYDITWAYTYHNRSGKMESSCVEVIARENNNLRDYTVLRYDSAPNASLPLNLSRRPREGDRLTIFSHPQGVPLAWSGFCQHEGSFSAQKFAYKCDTLGGSSGAAVLNENLEIVGVHNLGSTYYQVNAGTYLMDIPMFQ